MSGLVIHRPGSQKITLDQLRELPIPEALGSRHRPVPHATLVDALTQGIEKRGCKITKMDLAIAGKGSKLFGTMDISWFAGKVPTTLRGWQNDTSEYETGTIFGFRSSTDQSFAVKGVAGARTFVCDNMAFAGEEFVLSRKHTLYMNLPEVISTGLNKFLEQADILRHNIERLKGDRISDAQAKTQIFDLFNAGALPLHLFDDVARHYLQPQENQPDCLPRTMWGLTNACTRAIKVLKPEAQFNSAKNIGRHFHLAIPTLWN